MIRTLPVVPTRGVIVFPNSMGPLTLGRERSIAALEAVGDARMIAMFAQRDPTAADPIPDELHEIGTAGIVLRAARLAREQDTTLAFVEGLTRIRRGAVVRTHPYIEVEIEELAEIDPVAGPEAIGLERNIRDLFEEIIEGSSNLSQDLVTVASNLEGARAITDFVAATLPSLSAEAKQELLEELDVTLRMRRLVEEMIKERESLRLRDKIQAAVTEKISGIQREALLRQQLEAIKRELGENGGDLSELRDKLDQADLPDEARAEADRELERLAQIPAASPEHSIAATYLEWLAALPWRAPEPQPIDLDDAERILDTDHYDLERVKERILEHLAVFSIKRDLRGPILCLVGPPGVGKTSLGRSIARAMDRPFVRISLGGMHDEAGIRGHRRTYVGAMPGQIIRGLRRAGRADPVFMLDEIDKLGRDFRGDPAAALLEVLDPEQNSSFRDNYLDVPYDLSHVLFLTTANLLDPIPRPLLDRTEVIEIPGYTREEKAAIARRYLVPQQAEAHGLTPDHIEFTDGGLDEIIGGHTREAGVRELERKIAAICRKRARRIAGNGDGRLVVTDAVVGEMLGPARYHIETEIEERTRAPGVAVGLAWTPVGGEILFVEASAMAGKGNFAITGQVQKVMEESARAALTWFRSHAQGYGIDPRGFAGLDLHIHVPAGAVPKDGPSAGVAMVVALASLLTARPVRSEVAMTGEITLSGFILRIGGVKEKVLAARRCGISEIILPAGNRPDVLDEIPEELGRGLTFHFVDRVEEALELALEERPAREHVVSLPELEMRP